MKGYKLWNPKTSKVIISRNVVFNETMMYCSSNSHVNSQHGSLPHILDQSKVSPNHIDSHESAQIQVEHTIAYENTENQDNSRNLSNNLPSTPSDSSSQSHSIETGRPRSVIKPTSRFTNIAYSVAYAFLVAEEIEKY